MTEKFTAHEVKSLLLMGTVLLVADIWLTPYILHLLDPNDWRVIPTIIMAILVAFFAISAILVPSSYKEEDTE